MLKGFCSTFDAYMKAVEAWLDTLKRRWVCGTYFELGDLSLMRESTDDRRVSCTLMGWSPMLRR